MRKWSAIFFSILLVLSLSAGGQADKDNETGNRNSQVSAEKNKNNTGSTSSNTRVLIAYFTVLEDVKTSDNDAIAGASIVVKDSEKMGNTEYVAGLVQKTIGGDLFRIETKDAYPLEHETLVDQAAEEQEKELRPELSNHVENFEQYDTVILGFPNWWGDLPMPVYSFLEEYDFTGKTIIPFCSHGGGRFGQSLTAISKLAPEAVMGEALSVHYFGGSGLSDDMEECLK